MTDIASLSFNIDASQVQPASDQLDRLSDSAEKVRASTRFLVSDFSNTNDALQQLATSGRASLGAFVAISQDLDSITAKLDAMRQAAADTVSTLGGSNMSAALTTFQQQFTTMAALFGTSAAQLEAFNKQAEYLGMNSYQVTAALQRITQAQQNMTPAGAAIRQALNQEGISTNQDASQIVQQVQSYYGSHAQSQQAYDTLQLLLGPLDPATATSLRYQGYRSVDQRRQEFVGQTLGQQGSQTAQTASDISYQNKYNRDAYNDTSSYVGLLDGYFGGRGEYNQFSQDLSQRARTDTGAQRDQDRQLLAQLQAAQPGSQNALAVEGQFDVDNPNDPLARRTMSYAGRAQLGLSPISGTPSWYQRFTDSAYQADNQNYINAAYDDARGNVGPGFLGIPGALRDFALNTDEISDTYANRLGLYTGPSAAGGPIQRVGRNGVRYNTASSFSSFFGAPALPTTGDTGKPIGAVESAGLYRQDAAVAQQFGYGGFNDVAGAKDAQAQLQSTGPGSDLDRLQRLFGSREGQAIINQQLGAAGYTIANAATPGYDQLQQLNTQGFQASQIGGQDAVSALLSFAQGQGIQTGRFLGSGLSASQIMAGQGAAGAALTPGQVQAFQQILSQINANGEISQQAQFTQSDAAASTQLGLAQTTTGGDYQARLAGLQAYQEAVKRTNDSVQQLRAYEDAVTLAFKQQAIAAEEATKSLQAMNDVQAKALGVTGSALMSGQPGAYGAAQAENQIQQQLAQFRQANPTGNAAAYEQQLRRQQQTGLLAGAQDSLAGVQNQVFGAQGALAGFGSDDARNRSQTDLEFASQLQSATGDTKTALEQMVDSIVDAKDNLDGLNQKLSDLQGAIAGFTEGGAADAALGASPGQQAQATAGYRAKAGVLSATDPLAMLPPSARAALAPYLPQLQGLITSAGLPPQALGVIGADMSFESSGKPGAVGSDPYSSDGTAVGLGQFSYQTGKQFGLVGPGFDNRSNAQMNMKAMVQYWGQLMQMHGGNWNDPNAVLAAAGDYGTIPHGMTAGGLGNGDLAAAGAVYGVNAQQALAARNLGYATGTSQAALAAQLPLLQIGATGRASLAAASVVNPTVPDLEKSATQAQQLSQATENLSRAIAELQADTTQRIAADDKLAAANLQGTGAVRLANAQISSQQSALQVGQDNNPLFMQALTQQNMEASAAAFGKAAAEAERDRRQQLDLRQTEMSSDLYAGRYQRITNDAQAQQNQQDNIDRQNGVDPKVIASNDSLSQQSAALDVIAAKQQVVAQGMGQIGDAVGGTLQNLALSYQHGPGAGLYARQQLGGLFNTASRSIFNTAIGDPISNLVSSNLSGLVNTLLGNTSTPGNGNSSGAAGGGNGTGSAASQTLGGIGGIFQNLGVNNLLGDAAKGIGSYLFGSGAGAATSAFTSAPGAVADELGATTNPGISSGIGSIFSSIASLFNTGGVVSGGVRQPFATGAVFGGPRYPFASGDVFTDPTNMPMATIGEAGPEAVMPLKRGADGKLGIATSGGGGASSIVVNAPITVGQGALQNNGTMDQRKQADLQRQLHQTITRAVQGVIADQSRPGGMVQPQS